MRFPSGADLATWSASSPCTASSELVGAPDDEVEPDWLAAWAVSFWSVFGVLVVLVGLTEAPECVSLLSTRGSSVRLTYRSKTENE